MSEPNGYLPPGWCLTNLGGIQLDLSKIVDPDESFELYSVPSHERCEPEVTKGNEIGSNKQTVEPGTVLLCKINPRINRVWMVGNHSSHEKIASTEWIPFFPLPSIEPRYLAYFLRQGTIRDFLARNASGVGGSLMRVRAGTFRDFPFLIAPLSEQARVADALDELFSDLDAGVATLERVKLKLELYRASVLKAAVEGALTAEWRQEHPNVEPASELLRRILAERRRRWESDQLGKFKIKGQQPPKNWKAKYKEPVSPDTTNLPLPPEGWCWSSLDQLSSFVTSGSRGWKECYTEAGPIFIRSQDIKTDRLEVGNVAHVCPPTNSEGMRTKVQRRDILITITGANVAKAALVDIDLSEAYVSQHVGLIRLADAETAGFVHLFAITPSGGRKRLLPAAYGAGKPGLNLDNLKELEIPLPPVLEMATVVEAVEDQLSVVDHLETDLDAKSKNAQALRQAILRDAFTAKLVPQDPNDEPASDLLKRIAIERETANRKAAAVKRASNGLGTGQRGRLKTKKRKRITDGPVANR